MRLLAALGATAAAAASITITLPATPNPFQLPADTHATLSSLGGQFSAPLSAANTFVFHNVTDGSYLGDIHCRTDAYRPIRVDIGNGAIHAWDTFRGNDWANKGEVLPVTEGVIEARALGKKEYFTERPACE